MKIAVNANVFIPSFLDPAGPPRSIINLRKSGKITLCLGAEFLAEYIGVLEQFHITSEDLNALLDLFKLSQFMEFTIIAAELRVVFTGPADDKFMECALVSSARCPVSGDKHLLSIARFGSVEVVKTGRVSRETGELENKITSIPIALGN